MWHGIEPKDLDLFVTGLTVPEMSAIVERIQADLPEGMVENVRDFTSDAYAFHHRTILYILDLKVDACPWPLQIIFVADKLTPEQLVHSFDFNMCKIGMALGHDVVTPQFIMDSEARTFTYSTSPSPDYSVQRFLRWREKYPHHILVMQGRDSHGIPIGPDGMSLTF